MPIRCWPADGSYEYRFHPACIEVEFTPDDGYEGGPDDEGLSSYPDPDPCWPPL